MNRKPIMKKLSRYCMPEDLRDMDYSCDDYELAEILIGLLENHIEKLTVPKPSSRESKIEKWLRRLKK